MSSVPRTTVNKQEMPAWRRTASAKATSLSTMSARSAPSTRDHHPPRLARDTDGPHMRAHDVAALRPPPSDRELAASCAVLLLVGPPRFPSRPRCATDGPGRPGTAQLPRAPAYAARPEQLRQGPPKRLSGDCHDRRCPFEEARGGRG